MSAADLIARIDAARGDHQRANDLIAEARDRYKPPEPPPPPPNEGMDIGSIAHTALDFAGFIPGIGVVADLAHAAWYAAEGDYKNAALSAAAAVPGAGDALKAGKMAIRGADAAAGTARMAAKGADAGRHAFGPCFIAGTKVLTSQGARAIESLSEGDEVHAYDPISGQYGVHTISQTLERTVPVVFDIQIGDTTITCSPEHPFWVPDVGWQKAGKLEPGDCLLTKTNQIVSIDSIERREGAVTVYNITVDVLQTYFVGDLCILVHNKAARRPFKEPKKGAKGKEGATDAPSWAKGEKPFKDEKPNDFARRVMDAKYGAGNYKRGPGSEFNKIQKYAQRHFERR